MSHVLWDRLQFAFTISFHYLFPQLTMGLALLILILKSLALRKGDERYNKAARFWAKIFAVNFVIGVVTGIPMEFQFGTNWAQFSDLTGGVIGQTLAMEGMFSFFLESSFLGLFLFGEKKLGPRMHWLSSFLVWLGSWLSGYFIVATNAWMQHPVGYKILDNGKFVLTNFWALIFNPWAFWQYLHTMIGSVVTASFVMAGIGAFYVLSNKNDTEWGKMFARIGVIAGVVASVLMAFPTGDQQARMVDEHQPATIAAMEGIFHTQKRAPIYFIGQPNMEQKKLDNPLYMPGILSFLTYRHFDAEVKGMDAFKEENLPDNIPLLYYAYHIMVGLGTIFIAVLLGAVFLLWRGTLFENKWMLWLIILCTPFPFLANTAGWMTAELGRQPWLVYGLLRTASGASPNVTGGNTLFTLIGFIGMYFLIGVLFLVLVGTIIRKGPENRTLNLG
ncbi:MAG TPA: cytochrome ubiquinol oxidase subunit I [Balneolaceae bacterium]|nr:cytochrome ubiquinol oxidase subunit I [Balneolaceae bacterium]